MDFIRARKILKNVQLLFSSYLQISASIQIRMDRPKFGVRIASVIPHLQGCAFDYRPNDMSNSLFSVSSTKQRGSAVQNSRLSGQAAMKVGLGFRTIQGTKDCSK